LNIIITTVQELLLGIELSKFSNRGVRLLGIALSNLDNEAESEIVQLALFDWLQTM
jgi:hypothetical protein